MSQEQVVQLIFIILPFIMLVASALFTLYIVPKLPAQKQAQAISWAQQAAQAVEQLASNNLVGMTSADKKARAVQFVQQIAKSVGISLDPQVVDQAIESAVFLLNQSQSVTLAPATTMTAPQSSGDVVGSTSASTSPGASPASA